MSDQNLERELTQHAASLRHLAAALVGNDDAEDLVHETALRAMRQPLRSGPLGGFLHTILRRLASKHRRGEARRRQRERASARDDRLPAVDQQLARHEVVLRLARALAALPEPYRATLLRRYFEDCRPAVIAERDGVPVETVKTRLKRGLTKLRERLDAEGVGDDWRVGLTMTFGFQPTAVAGAVAAATPAVLLLGTTAKVLLGGVAVVAAAATVWFVGGESQPAPAAVRTEVAATPIVAAADVETRSETQAIREPVAEPTAAPAAIHGRCVDELGAPLADVEATLRRWTGGNSTDVAPALRTLVNGRFAFAATVERRATFVAEWHGTGRLHRRASLGELQPGQVVDLGDVALLAGARVRGRVVDAGGRAIAGVSVTIHDLPIAAGGPSLFERIWLNSNDDGTFVFEDVVPPGTWRLEAAGAKHAQVGPKSVTVHSGETDVELVVVCAPTPSIEGIIVDEAGKPIVGIQVVLDNPPSGRSPVATSGPDGRFELHSLEFQPPPRGLAISRATGYQRPLPTELIAWGSRDVRIMLQRGLRLEFEVVERESGRPVEAFAVADGGAHKWPMAKVENGRRTIDGVQRGARLFAVLPQDPMLLQSTCIRIAAEQQTGAVRVEIERLTPLQVRVEDTRGRPIVGSLIEVFHLGRFFDELRRPYDLRRIWPTVDDDFDLFGSVLPILYSEATADDTGVATLAVARADPDVGVRVTGKRHAPLIVRHPTLMPGEPLVVTVEPAASIRGRLRIDGYAGGVVALVLDTTAELPFGYGEVPVAPDGTFTVEGLVPGAHPIRLALHERYQDGFSGSSGARILEPPLVTVDLIAGETREVELDATRWNAGRVRGRVVVDGVGLAAARVGLSTPHQHGRIGFGMFTADERGTFSASGLLPGDYTLRLQPDVSGEPILLAHPDVIAITAGGTVEREFHFVRRRLLVRVRTADGRPMIGGRLYAKLSSGEQRVAQTDAAGRAVFDWMPAGRGVLTTVPRVDDTPFEIPATQTEVTLELVVEQSR